MKIPAKDGPPCFSNGRSQIRILQRGCSRIAAASFFAEKQVFPLIRPPFTPGERFPDKDFPILSLFKVGRRFSPYLKHLKPLKRDRNTILHSPESAFCLCFGVFYRLLSAKCLYAGSCEKTPPVSVRDFL